MACVMFLENLASRGGGCVWKGMLRKECHLVTFCSLTTRCHSTHFFFLNGAIIFFEGLDAPFLPLRQSDMCLVCIAFASWVLKTANPQVGDAWKAGMLIDMQD